MQSSSITNTAPAGPQPAEPETAEERYARRVAQYNRMATVPDKPMPMIWHIVSEYEQTHRK